MFISKFLETENILYVRLKVSYLKNQKLTSGDMISPIPPT